VATTIRVLYTCTFCKLHRVPVEVTERGDMPLERWMQDALTPALVRDHYERSPVCRPSAFDEVLIPVDDDGKTGLLKTS